MIKWMRVRFHANVDDYRPVKWPPPGPYWCSATSFYFSVVIAYIPINESAIDFQSLEENIENIIKEFWPEANNIETSGDQFKDAPGPFSERFPCPEWWDKEECKVCVN